MGYTKTIYEYACEYVTDDEYGDVEDSEFGDKLSDVWPPRLEVEDCIPRLALVRSVHDALDGEQLKRSYAYEGNTHFDCGAKVPKHLAI